MLFDENPVCPSSVNCTEIESRLDKPHLVSLEIGRWPSYVAIVSSTLSCLGSLLILITYFAIKDIRTGAQKIITLLAVADFISAAGYIMGSVNFLTHFNQDSPGSCKVFERVCLAQATITSWSSLVSFWWTVILAFYFCLIMVYRRLQLAGKLMPLYNIIAWGSPLLIVIPLLATGNLGYAPYAASNWCFVRVKNYSDSNFRHEGLTIFIVFMAGKLWEILSYVIVTILYIMITVHMGRTRRQIGNGVLEPKLIQVESRLLAIPILFILLRMWGTIQFLFSLAVAGTVHEGCVPNSVHIAFVVLGILQAIGDSGQGWGNAILYVFVSPTIRRKLFDTCCGVCLDMLEDGQNDQTNTRTQTITRTHDRVSYKNGKRINVHNEGSTEGEPLIASSPAIGYNIKRYDTTTTCTVTDGNEMIHRLTSEPEFEASNVSTAT